MANLRAFLFLIASFAVAITLIVFGPRWADKWGTRYDLAPQPLSEIGQLNNPQGLVSVRSFQERDFVAVSGSLPIRQLDTLRLGARAQVELQINGFVLRVSGPALAVPEKWSSTEAQSPVVLHLISGHVEEITPGQAGQLYVLRGGELTDVKGASVPRIRGLLASGLTVNQTPQAAPVDSATSQAPTSAQTPAADHEPQPETLTNEYLDSEIAKQQDQFQRCQSNALRDGQEAKGQILIGLTIATTGKIEEARILSSTIQNEGLHQCLLEVFQRIRFKEFKGAPIVRSYPLVFE